MNYHDLFDRLGNPLPQPRKPSRLHRALQLVCAVACIVLVYMLATTPGANP